MGTSSRTRAARRIAVVLGPNGAALDRLSDSFSCRSSADRRASSSPIPFSSGMPSISVRSSTANLLSIISGQKSRLNRRPAPSNSQQPLSRTVTTSKHTGDPGMYEAKYFSSTLLIASQSSPMMNSANWLISNTAASRLMTKTSTAHQALSTSVKTKTLRSDATENLAFQSASIDTTRATGTARAKAKKDAWMNRTPQLSGSPLDDGMIWPVDMRENGRVASSWSSSPVSPLNSNW
mmetsp:Transcript_1022/g.4375  ORF Transcript_1022/g.4375 Transcript_1022/m.4375 type:complete len:236 (-) Transcript_1022:1759-2466(-)|eukprot:scaffold47_cov258-Pinguiococcus_pyrenoidosus.AAC.7